MAVSTTVPDATTATTEIEIEEGGEGEREGERGGDSSML